MKQEEFAKIDEYIQEKLRLQDELLLKVEEEIRKADIGWQNISPNQGRLLQTLATICNAKRILEIGTFGGYSAIWMARALKDDGKLTTLELDENYAAVAQKNFHLAKVADKIELRLGKAVDVLLDLEREQQGPFDMIFIDADKPSYPDYFKWALRLSRPGTLIVVDNVIKYARVLDPDMTDERMVAVRKFNDLLGESEQLTSIIIQTVGVKIPDGIAIAVVR
jgi:caffeoyl-CoA O-methyltransferase